MSIKSMTGFARAEGSHDGAAWHWEVRSVNGRGLDCACAFRPAPSSSSRRCARPSRGTWRAAASPSACRAERNDGGAEIRINERALAQVMVAAARIRTLTDAAPPRVDGLITIKGVLDLVEQEEIPRRRRARSDAMLKSLDGALIALVAARAAEGARLAATLNAQLDEIERLVRIVQQSPARTPEAIEQRLKEQVGRLLEAATASTRRACTRRPCCSPRAPMSRRSCSGSPRTSAPRASC